MRHFGSEFEKHVFYVSGVILRKILRTGITAHIIKGAALNWSVPGALKLVVVYCYLGWV